MASLIVEESVKLQLMVYFAEDDVAVVFGIRTVSVNTFIGSDGEIIDIPKTPTIYGENLTKNYPENLAVKGFQGVATSLELPKTRRPMNR